MTAALSADELFAEATTTTGLDDLGDPAVLDNLQQLVTALSTQVDLTEFGVERLRTFLVDKLVVRLRLGDLFATSPELARQHIEQPVFIVGLPRTGSTLLHHLFAVDQRTRVPQRWEMLQPLPPPEASTYRTDPRIAIENEALRPMLEAAPDIAAMHPMRGDFPEECMHILTGAFASSVFVALTGCVEFDRRMRGFDMESAYRFHRRYLQVLQWKCPGAPWVLKSPMHTGYIEAINAVYPDARFVWLHRDPYEVLTSWCLLTITMQQRHVRDVDVVRAAADKVDEWAWHVAAGHAARVAIDDEERFFDVRFSDFVAAPVPVMERVFRWLDLTLPAPTAADMQTYVEHPPYPRGGYSRDASRYELDPDVVQARFADYTARYL